MLAWERLGAVAIGPLLEPQTEANIDLVPTRASMVEFNVTHLPADTTILRRTGVAGAVYRHLNGYYGLLDRH
jgi:hypothetical protein